VPASLAQKIAAEKKEAAESEGGQKTCPERSRRIPSPQLPSFLPACFRASPDFFADGLQIKKGGG